MEQIAKTAGILCLLVVSMDLLCNIGSFPATQKVIRFVIAIHIVLSGFNIADNNDTQLYFSLQPEYTGSYDYKQEFEDTVIKETEKITKDMITVKLSEKNIAYNYIDVHILEQNDILFADEIVIQCDNDKSSDVKECIKEYITEDTKLIIGE